jgi:hypothetical protein
MCAADTPYVINADQATYHDNVRVVEMPCCGFCFDADQSDAPPVDGHDGEWPVQYTCPLCAPADGDPPAA